MRYDSPSFRIDKTDFLKGNNAYNDMPSGGVKAETVGMNPFSKPGLLAQRPSLGTEVTTALPTGGTISWGIGSGTSAPSVMCVMTNIDDNGLFYTVDPSTGAFTRVGTDDTTRSYSLGVTDTVFYNGDFYTTSETDICKNSADLTTRDQSWWITTSGQTALTAGIPHPLLVYESIMYIADGRYLHKLDGTDISTQVWDAPPDHIITAIVEYNGLIYIVAEPYKNLTGSVHGLAQMFSWDGLLESWYEQYFIDYRVNSLYVYKNTLYAWTNDFLGLWTGSELEPIYPVSAQVFKCQITATADSMYYADGTNVMRYGKPFIPGLTKKFYRYLESSEYNFTGIISASDNSMIVTELNEASTHNFFISDMNTPATSSQESTFNFNTRYFVKPVKVRAIAVNTEALGLGQKVKVGFINSEGDTIYPNKDNGTFDNSVSKMEGKTTWRFDAGSQVATRSIIPVITTTAGVHVRSVDYLYEGSENKSNE